MRQPYTRFFVKLCVFVSPIVFLIGIISAFGLQSGELLPVSYIAEWQSTTSENLLFESSWTRREVLTYKLASSIHRDPDVLVLTSSRGYSFIDAFFHDDTRFYNASVPSLSPIEMHDFIQHLIERDTLPAVIIINLDYHYFTPTYVQFAQDNEWETSYVPLASFFEHYLVTSQYWVESLPDVTAYHPSVEELNYRPVGLRSFEDQYGFRNDGSYFRADWEARRTQRIDAQYEWYTTGTALFQSADQLSQSTLDTYRDILELGQAHDMTIFGITLPYLSPLYESMITDERFKYVSEMQATSQALFNTYDMPYLLIETPQTVGGTDFEMYDTHHTGEILTWRIMQYIIAQDASPLSSYTSVEHLASITPNRNSDIYLFGNRPYHDQ